jgi:hypothetical protein
MDMRELAADYVVMVAAGQMSAAAQKYWSDDIRTWQAMPGDMAQTHGKARAPDKAHARYANNEIHGFRSEGPFVNGDSFLILMEIDLTPKGGGRMQMREVVSYRMAHGKVVEEQHPY